MLDNNGEDDKVDKDGEMRTTPQDPPHPTLTLENGIDSGYNNVGRGASFARGIGRREMGDHHPGQYGEQSGFESRDWYSGYQGEQAQGAWNSSYNPQHVERYPQQPVDRYPQGGTHQERYPQGYYYQSGPQGQMGNYPQNSFPQNSGYVMENNEGYNSRRVQERPQGNSNSEVTDMLKQVLGRMDVIEKQTIVGIDSISVASVTVLRGERDRNFQYRHP